MQYSHLPVFCMFSYTLLLYSTSVVFNHNDNWILRRRGMLSQLQKHTCEKQAMIIVKYHGKGIHLFWSPMIFIKDLQWWKSLYIPHSKNLEGGERGKNLVLYFVWIFNCFVSMTLILVASNANHIVKNGTCQNKQEKYQRYLCLHFTKDKMHRKGEFCSLDLRSPWQSQISWKLVLLLNDKMIPFSHTFLSHMNKCHLFKNLYLNWSMKQCAIVQK